MNDRVLDDEILYRRVPNDPRNFSTSIDGIPQVDSHAFMDRAKQISVDRAKLCNFEPTFTQDKNSSNGVVQLVAQDIREIDHIDHGTTHACYGFDIVPAPIKNHPSIEDNFAHAEIWSDPQNMSKGVFRRLRRALAVIANNYGWLILPEDAR